MYRLLTNGFCIVSMLIIVACSNDSSINKMEQIKEVGNEDANLAIAMLDSLELDSRNASEYVRNKYDLLRIRLRDKAFIPHTSDIMIVKLVNYFEEEGTTKEKQEACYYAGSVYRDLKDTPRALEYFYKSIDYAKSDKRCDSIMLRNTYSNLCYLQYRVQNFKEANVLAEQELELSKQLGYEDLTSYMHIGASYEALNNMKQADKAYGCAYKLLEQAKEKSYYQEDAIRLLIYYSSINQIKKASICKSYVYEKQPKHLSALKDRAFASYYKACGKIDSAIFLCNRVINGNADINDRYDASKLIYLLYRELGDLSKANEYARIYMQLSDSLDFGKRQELAATVTNNYKYNLDKSKEQNLKQEKEIYRATLMYVLLTSVIVISLTFALFIKKRNRQLRRIIELSNEMNMISNEDKQLREKIEQSEAELKESKLSFAKAQEELNQVKLEVSRVSHELNEYKNVLKDKEQQLAEKIEQNKSFIRLLHQSEFEGKAEDVIHTIRQSAKNGKELTPTDWRQLFKAVDELYPDFKDTLTREIGTFNEKQMQVFYLLRIGMERQQIQMITTLSRVTLWRWTKKYEWVMSHYDRLRV